jgi:RimJ/RimL family protein N-acetyltransferase
MNPSGRPVSIATERFTLRSHVPSDSSERWCGWSGDPDIMGPLNMLARRSTREQLAKYIAMQDNDHSYLIGIYSKAMGQHVGFYQIDFNKLHRSAGFNVVIGDKQYWGKNAVNETRAALLTEFFERRGLEKAWGQPLARNFPMIFNYKQQGWRLEGILRGQCLSIVDGSRLDQYQFGMLRDDWRALTKAGTKS